MYKDMYILSHSKLKPHKLSIYFLRRYIERSLPPSPPPIIMVHKYTYVTSTRTSQNLYILPVRNNLSEVCKLKRVACGYSAMGIMNMVCLISECEREREREEGIGWNILIFIMNSFARIVISA